MRLAGLAALALVAASAAPAQNAPLELVRGETLLEVEARGVHLSRPDMMTISAGVVTVGPTAGAALQSNSALASRMLEAVRALDVAPRDIRTRDLSLIPQLDQRDERDAAREERQPRISGYLARNTLELRLRELARAPALIDALVRAGANNIQGPTFALEQEGEARRLARRDAMAQARQEADQFADAAGMRVARILRISERSRYSGQDDGGAIVVTGSRIAGAPVEPGEIATTVTVWVDFALLPK